MADNEKTIKLPLIRSVSKYILYVLKSFGLYEEDDTPKEDDGASGANKEEIITPYMNAMSEFRDKIKARASEGDKVMFQEADNLRDNVLPELGIRLGDKKAGEPAVWDFVDPKELLKEKEAKLALIAAKELKK
jgi:cysteinyl-tRNA synthetase